jgi:GT2 family glycosyltransferase
VQHVLELLALQPRLRQTEVAVIDGGSKGETLVKNPLYVMLAVAGRSKLLKRTLTSIAECEKPTNYVATVVVENGPRCGVEQVVRSFPADHAFRHLYSEPPSKSRALNVGMAYVGKGWVVLTDDDVRVRRDWIMAYAAAIADESRGRFFGGPIEIDAERGLPPRWRRRYYPASLAEPWMLAHAGAPVQLPGQTFMGTNWAVAARELLDIGGFDLNMGPGTELSVGEETEAQRRLEAIGSAPVYVPGAIVWHYLHREYLEPTWLLKRIYRHGMAWGIAEARRQGFSRWHVASAWLRRLNAKAKSALLRIIGGEKREFQAEYLLARWNGRWEGLTIGRNWPSAARVTLTTEQLGRAA